MKKHVCEGKPRVCPGHCNPRHRQSDKSSCQAGRQIEVLPYRQETVLNHNVYNRHEFSLFPRKTQTEEGTLLRPVCGDADALSAEERGFIDELSRRVEARRRRRTSSRSQTLHRLLVFFLFFLVHGCIAVFAKNYQQYQTFIATQLCGFITIMFWEPSVD